MARDDRTVKPLEEIATRVHTRVIVRMNRIVLTLFQRRVYSPGLITAHQTDAAH